MNRNGTAILATAILFSMLATSGVRPGPSAPHGNANPARLPGHHNSQSAAPDRHVSGNAGQSDYQREIDDLFKQFCQDGTPEKNETNKKNGTGNRRCSLGPDNFVIAIVPDPVHTHLALYFDRTIDTIEEALQDDGYIFYRAVVPWDHETHPESDDYKLRLDAERYQEGREHLPGIMLFRPSQDLGAEKGPLAVVLVGESPTSGIEKKQFASAIREIQNRTGIKESELTLRILGPTFSGSLSSLKELLTCGANPCYRLATILSGTISGRREVGDFQEKAADFQTQNPGPAKIIFDTFQETDDVMLERFIEFVSRDSYGVRDYAASSIAELSEDETAYGSLRHSGTGVLQLYFPREISQLRAAYQDTSASANATERLPFQTLPHNFGVTGEDTVASFSQKQTPLSQEAVLLSIVAELRKHAIEFVILNATDPLDTLFLSHYLRSAYPQGRIVTMGADMLFPRDVEDTSLHGILALSTYSVSPSANHQFLQLKDSGTERMFPSSSDIGTYNALHSLITVPVAPPPQNCQPSVSSNDCTIQLLSSNPEKPLHLIQYGWRERGTEFARYDAPPVRLSALGHDGYWPIATLGPSRDGKIPTLLPQVVNASQGLTPSAPVRQFDDGPGPVEVPNSWVVMEVAGLALAGGFCLSLWLGSLRSPWQQLAQFAPTMADARGRLIATAGIFLIFVLVILLWPYAHGRRDWMMIHGLRHAVILTAGIFVVLVVTLLDISHRSGLLDAIARHGGITWTDLQNRRVVLIFTATSVFLACFCLLFPEYSDERLAGIRHFEVLRAIQLTSGLSPILPVFFLLAAGLWWANHTVSGWILLDERCPRLPSGIAQPRIGEDDEIVQDLLKALRPGPSSVTHYLVLFGIGVGIFLLTGFTLNFIRTIEPSRFDKYQLFPLLAIASAGLIGTTLRLWTIWFRARQLLLTLDSSLLRRGFQRLEGFSWKPIWKFGGVGSLSEYQRILAREREALQSAVNVLPALEASKEKIDLALKQTRSAFETAKGYAYPASFAMLRSKTERTTKAYIRTLYSDIRALFSLREWAANRKAQQKLITQFGHFQEGVALAAHDALAYLADRWQHEKEEPKRHRGQETADELKTRACERFVSLVYTSFLLVVFARMRTLIVAISGMYILILLALTLYPFEPRPAIQTYLVVMLAFIVTVVGLVFAQIHRDATLSHITDTKPGELGGDFYLRMASFIALPLFTFFASQFPEIGRFFYSWLEPALQALNR